MTSKEQGPSGAGSPLPRGGINKRLRAQYTIASLDGDEDSLQRRRRRRRGARAGAQPGREAGEALAQLTSVFLFRELFISPPPAALLPERPLPAASASRRCLLRAGVTDEQSSGHPAPRAAARRHRAGRGPAESTRRRLQAACRRLSPPLPPPRQPARAPGARCCPSRSARGQARPGATVPCAPCERAAPRPPTQLLPRPKPRANFCFSARRSSPAREAPRRPRSRQGEDRGPA